MGLNLSLWFDTMSYMSKYEYHLDMRLDGIYYCRIYLHGVPGAIFFTDDYDLEEEAIEAVKVLIRGLRAKTDEIKKSKGGSFFQTQRPSR